MKSGLYPIGIIITAGLASVTGFSAGIHVGHRDGFVPPVHTIPEFECEARVNRCEVKFHKSCLLVEHDGWCNDMHTLYETCVNDITPPTSVSVQSH